MRPAFNGRVMRLFGAAIGDQVVLSGTNFLVGFVLIRFTSDRDYGLYVLVQSALLLFTTAQNAWLTGPLAVLAPKMPLDERREVIGAVKHTQRRWLRLAALPILIVPIASYLLGFVGALAAVVVGIAVIAGWAALRREYLRSVLLIYSLPHNLLLADSVYAVVLVLGIAGAVLVGKVVVVWATATLVIAALAGAAVADAYIAADPGWGIRDAGYIWPRIRSLGYWSVIGAVIYWLFTQSYNYVLATRVDLKAVADVNAARLMLMPAIVLTIGIAALLTPTAATWYAEVGLRRLVRRLLLFIVGVGILDIAYFGFVWTFRHWLIVDVLHKHINDQDRLLILWALVAIIGLMRDVLQCALFALARLKSMAWQTGVSAAVALLLMWFGLSWWGPAASLIGQICGEVVNLLGIVYLLCKALKSAKVYSSA